MTVKYLAILDDGHGMESLGNRTPKFPDGSFMKENEFNRSVVAKLNNKFITSNVDTYLTAPTDEDTPLNIRSSRANEVYKKYCDKYGKENVKCIFISVHANAYKSEWGEWGGIDTFYYEKGSYSSIEGKKLATMIQSSLIKGTELRNRGVKGANYHVLRETNMVSALCECAFMDNFHEAKLLMSEEYREECANEIFTGIMEYFSLEIKNEQPIPQGTSLIEKSKVTIPQAKTWLKNKDVKQKYIDMVDLYFKYGELTGIRPEILLCQSVKETGWFRFRGAVKEDMNNFAGIKIKKPQGDRTEDHETFPTIEDAVRSHFNHICAYTGLEPIGQPHDRYYVVKSCSWSGSIESVEELAGKYCPQKTYSDGILSLLADLESTPNQEQPETPTDDKEELNKLRKENESLKLQITGLNKHLLKYQDQNLQLKEKLKIQSDILLNAKQDLSKANEVIETMKSEQVKRKNRIMKLINDIVSALFGKSKE